jgi:DNA-binding NtrC family response regulator
MVDKPAMKHGNRKEPPASELATSEGLGPRPAPTVAPRWELMVAHPRDAVVPVGMGVHPTVLGRGAEALRDLGPGEQGEDTSLSRRHASLHVDGARLFLRDLASRNGTWVNGARVDATELRRGDLVGIGGLLMVARHARRPGPPLPAGVVIVSAAMLAIIEQLQQIAPLDSPVLIAGETGSGKDVVARLIHQWSGRRGPFVAANCAGVHDELASSEIFGHVRGAYTGATADRPGLARAADGGTLFLDEVGAAVPGLQAALLRLLESGEARALGSDRAYRVQTRFIAATHEDLEAALRTGRFREDLYARLARWIVCVPPLRERREDIMPLARHHAARLAGRPIQFSARLAEALILAPWSRNVRELEAVVERLVVSQGQPPLVDWDPDAFRMFAPRRAPDLGTSATEDDRPGAWPRRPATETLRARLAAHGGNVTTLAGELGVGRSTVYRWLSALKDQME